MLDVFHVGLCAHAIPFSCRSYQLKSFTAVSRVTTGGQNADVTQATLDSIASGGDIIVESAGGRC